MKTLGMFVEYFLYCISMGYTIEQIDQFNLAEEDKKKGTNKTN
jgi:hypothetical protein